MHSDGNLEKMVVVAAAAAAASPSLSIFVLLIGVGLTHMVYTTEIRFCIKLNFTHFELQLSCDT